MGNTVVVRRKSSGSDGSERMDKCVEKTHAAKQQQNHFQHGKDQIHDVKCLRCL